MQDDLRCACKFCTSPHHISAAEQPSAETCPACGGISTLGMFEHVWHVRPCLACSNAFAPQAPENLLWKHRSPAKRSLAGWRSMQQPLASVDSFDSCTTHTRIETHETHERNEMRERSGKVSGPASYTSASNASAPRSRNCRASSCPSVSA